MIAARDGGAPVVVGAHGTTASHAAMDWAVREARLRHAAVHLVLARDPARSRRAPYAPPAVPGCGSADAGRLAAAARRAARLLPPGWVTTELADGLPAKVLADRAAGAGLLVLGTARPAGHPAGILGPVARACLRHPPCPVVIITPGAAAGRAPRIAEGSGQSLS
jgi:nucleotide-binding universal stress UspA family protein